MGSRAGGQGVRFCLAVLVAVAIPALGVVGLPDLSLADATLDPSMVDQGEEAVAKVAVFANGLFESDTVTVRVSWRRLDLHDECCSEDHSVPVPQAYSGYVVEQRIDTSSLSPGSYEVTLAADPDNAIGEADETNNELALLLTVMPLRPEIHPTELAFLPSSPVARGEAVAVTTEVENSGHRVSGGFDVQFQLLPTFYTSEDGESLRVVPSLDSTDAGEPQATWTFEPLSAGEAVDTEAWLASVGAVLDDQMWIPFWSTHVQGLDTADSTELIGVLPTGEALRALLKPDGVEVLSGSIMPPLDDDGLLESEETSFVIRVVVDPTSGEVSDTGDVLEEDDTNNEITGALTVRASDLGRPELQPIRLYFEGPLPLEWEDRQDITAVVRNTGGTKVGEDQVKVRFEYRPIGTGSTEWLALGAGNSHEVVIDEELGVEEGENTQEVEINLDVEELNLAPGRYELRATVIPDDSVPEESNESNNSMVIGFSVEGAEIHPTGILLGSNGIRQGDRIPISVPVRNTGQRTLTSFVVGFYLDDLRFDTFYYYVGSVEDSRDDGLSRNDTVWAQGLLETEDLPVGEYELRAVVDPENAIPEMDEWNNTATQVIEIQSREARRPELVPISLSLDPESPMTSDGGNLTVDVQIANRGTLDASAFQVRADVRGPDGRSWLSTEGSGSTALVQRLDRAGRTTVSLVIEEDLLLVPGEYGIRIVVDPANQVVELDEQNNFLLAGFHVGLPQENGEVKTLRPNLVFTSLAVTPTQEVNARQLIAVTKAEVRNSGMEPTGAFSVTFCWQKKDGSCDPTGVVARVENGLAADASVDIAAQIASMEAPALTGSYSLCGLLDSQDEVDEGGREWDNQACAYVQVTGAVKPDLAVDSVWFSPEPPLEEGDSVTAYARIRNVSSDVGAGAFDVRFEQLDGGPVRDYPISSLGPGQTRDLSFGLSTSNIGDFVLQVTADVNDDVTESDDDDETNNNVASVSFSVAAVLPETVEEVTSLGSAARFVEADTSRDIVYAASTGGHVVALQAAQDDEILFDVTIAGNEVVDVALLPGSGLYVAQSDRVVVLDPLTGASLDEILIPESLSATVLAVRSDETLYVGTTSGVMVVASGSIAMGGGPDEQVAALVVDSAANYTYVMTASSVYVLDDSLVVRCNITNLPRAPVALALGPNALYVGTDDGTVSAYTLCNGGGIIRIWQAAGDGLLSSIVVDPNDFDPIYVGVQEGRLVALDAFGRVMWPFVGSESVPLAELVSPPAWDGRTGRVFLVDMDGTAWILDSSGSEAFPIDSSASQGVSVRSTLVIDDYVTSTSTGAQIERVYYYGGEDGKVYVLRTER